MLQHNPTALPRQSGCVMLKHDLRSTDVVFVLGTDEAGYGPNLGPLVIGASAWKVPNRSCAERLYELLSATVSAETDADGSKVAIADSKRLYKPGMLSLLERGVLTALTLLERCASRWRDVWEPLDPECVAQ